MKSAYERAMERFGSGPIREYDDEQKEQLAEIDRIFDARIAQAKFAGDDRIWKADTPEDADKARANLTAEIASLNEKREREKNALREQFDK